MTIKILPISLLITIKIHSVTPFATPNLHRRQPPRSMVAPGTGMGTTRNNASKGMSKKSQKSSPPSFDVAKSLLKSEKRYEELLSESTKAFHAAEESEEDPLSITTEYVVAARGKHGGSSAASDWVPVAQICVVRPVHTEEKDGELDPSVSAGVSYYCREIHHAACLASPATFRSMSRSCVEYSVETTDSFFKFVYEDVIKGKSSGSIVEGGSTVVMTKSKAREVLGLEIGCKDPLLIKQAYKKKAYDFHPDRFVNSGKTQEEIAQSSNQFLTVKMAYEALTSGVRAYDKSWYESLGGKSRTEFYGPIELLPVEKAGLLCNKAFLSAVTSLDRDLTLAFVARNQAAALSA